MLTNVGMVGLQSSQILLLEQGSDGGSTGRAGLGIVQLEVSHTQRMTETVLVSVLQDLGWAPQIVHPGWTTQDILQGKDHW